MKATRADALCLAWVGACVVLVAAPWWPVHAALLDNPAHIAEILGVARGETGWSDLAFCGFDVTLFHSPLLYDGAALLVRAGVPIALLYPLCALGGFVAPALACLVVARRRMPPAPAAMLTTAMLLRPEAIVGIQSPLGGMWPFALALATFVLLVGALGAPAERPFVRVALLVGLTLSLHVLGIALVLLALGAWALTRPRAWQAASLGAVIGAGLGAGTYLPFAMSRSWMTPAQLTLTAHDVVVPLLGDPPIVSLVLAAAGALGVLSLRRREDDVPRLGVVVAAIALLILTLAPLVPALGVYALRAVPVLRVGCVLVAIPFVAVAWERAAERARHAAIALAVALTLLGAGVGGAAIASTSLGASDPAAREIESLWAWLRTHRTSAWGRVYLQDTFRAHAWPAGAQASHVLARTHDETGVDQAGAYYAAFPAPTSAWTRSEHDRLFDHVVATPADAAYVVRRLEEIGASHLVLVDPDARPLFSARSDLRLRFQTARVSVFEREGASFVGAGARTIERSPGHTTIDVVRDAPGPLVVRDAFHPSWIVRGGGHIARSAHGLIEIRDLSSEGHRLVLDYEPPRWPWLVSLVSLVVLLSVGMRSRPSPVAAPPSRGPSRTSSSVRSRQRRAWRRRSVRSRPAASRSVRLAR